MKTLIPRKLDIAEQVRPGRVLILLGPRRVGKTTLVKSYVDASDVDFLFLNGDNFIVRNTFASEDITQIKALLGVRKDIVIDEAQRIPQLGWGLKQLIDENPSLNIVVTGSSALEIIGQTGEPLTGRKFEHKLYPIAYGELTDFWTPHKLKSQLDNFLVYGMYPEVITAPEPYEKQVIVTEIMGSYLLKDILEQDKVKGSKKIQDLLILLAHQVGSEVSIRELAQTLDMDVATVDKYLDLLEKSYVIYSLRGFSRNMRSEVTRFPKYYFYDLGVRNALIDNFSDIAKRDDIGKLWENFCIIERLKHNSYKRKNSSMHFWRTWQQKETDLIEEYDGKLHATEFKWSPRTNASAPRDLLESYAGIQFQVIHRENFEAFIVS